MLKRLNQKGFSLVELMVVVAIIGILASIAIPQFQKFTAKARQSEVKANLGAIAKAQGAFKAEFLGYSDCLAVINFAPEGQTRYNIGFGGDGAGACIVTQDWLNSKNLTNSGTVPANNVGTNDVRFASIAAAATGSKQGKNARQYCGNTGTINNGCQLTRGADNNFPPALTPVAITATVGFAAVDNAVRGEPSFIAGGIGVVYRTNLDVWSIDDNGRMTNGTDGLQ